MQHGYFTCFKLQMHRISVSPIFLFKIMSLSTFRPILRLRFLELHRGFPHNSNLLAFIGYSGSCTSFLELHRQYFIAGLVFTQLNHFLLQGDALLVSVNLHNRVSLKTVYPHLVGAFIHRDLKCVTFIHLTSFSF